MTRPEDLLDDVDPGPVQIQARKVHFDVSDTPLHWIPGHPVASNVVSLLNLILPAAERWFVATYNEALPLVKDPKLAEDMRGFIGQEGAHAEVHQRLLHEFMEERGVDPTPMVEQVEYLFGKVLAPSASDDPRKRMNHLCDRLWFIAAIEHYTAVMGDFALNCTWDEYGADPTMAENCPDPSKPVIPPGLSKASGAGTHIAARVRTRLERCSMPRNDRLRCSRNTSPDVQRPPGLPSSSWRVPDAPGRRWWTR